MNILANDNKVSIVPFEGDEDTTIIKFSDNPPNSKDAHFVDNDGMPADHYLWLTGKAAQMLRREIPLSIEMPERL